MSDEAERPILFSASMVRAILASRKTMTRRIIKPQPVYALALIGADDKPTGEFVMCMQAERVISKHVRCPYGQPGDLLWVRETWGVGTRPHPREGWQDGIEYRADVTGDPDDILDIHPVTPPDGVILSDIKAGWRPSIHMPRWASRITLRVTDIRAARLQDISEADAEAEGAEPMLVPPDGGSCPHIEGFRELWNSINGAGAWDANPWVWVVKFERITP